MRFFKKIAGFLGFAKDEEHDARDVAEADAVDDADLDAVETHNLPRKGFSVAVKVPVERPQLGPVLVPCAVDDGGVQGLKWYARRLKIDEDGDVADEFLDEISPTVSSSGMEDHPQPFPRLQVKYNAKAAKVRRQALAPNGKVLQSVEYQGRLLWV
ncbi:hypothetical protein RHGRI_020362 [Rhododendron griersonianum]|uniref:Uncharacterized protein n=1 Tax=Rhododendron griersonianum TaxID=479676 RepID=A0AAV6JK99_9ERIC|nr:hypothetical protein RHGRI_020362 [Rhododendron griersonianum]